MLSGVALAWMVRGAREHGFPAWGKTAAVVMFTATLVTGNASPEAHRLVAPLIAGGMFVLALACAARERSAVNVSLRSEGLASISTAAAGT